MKVLNNKGVKMELANPDQNETKGSGESRVQQAKKTVQRISDKVQRGIYSASRNLDSNFRC